MPGSWWGCCGGGWSETRTCGEWVRVPTPEEEDRRQLHRELVSSKRDRNRVTNRIKSLLFGQGIRLENVRELPTRLGRMQIWNGEPVPEGLRERLWREWEKVEQLTAQIEVLTKKRRELLKKGEDEGSECARKLFRLRGLGENASWLFALEFFSWREFKNRREIGGLAGLTPTPYQSGDEQREQGMSKAGSRWIRDIAVEIAWGWLRYQPQSELSLWYARRFAEGSSRLRRIGIVAVARKLLVELWKYLETGTPPPGATLKA